MNHNFQVWSESGVTDCRSGKDSRFRSGSWFGCESGANSWTWSLSGGWSKPRSSSPVQFP